MSDKDLVKELKAELAEITKDRDDALTKMKSKESRIKQVLIKLEHREQDVHSCGQKIGEQNKEIEALHKIKDIHDDSTQKTNTHRDNPDLD